MPRTPTPSLAILPRLPRPLVEAAATRWRLRGTSAAFTGLARVLALSTGGAIAAMKACWRFIRPTSEPLPSYVALHAHSSAPGMPRAFGCRSGMLMPCEGSTIPGAWGCRPAPRRSRRPCPKPGEVDHDEVVDTDARDLLYLVDGARRGRPPRRPRSTSRRSAPAIGVEILVEALGAVDQRSRAGC